ncbi:heparinase II/III family protein [Bacteroidota bacterium]
MIKLKKYNHLYRMLIILLFLIASTGIKSQDHPLLLLSDELVEEMQSGVELYPLWHEIVENYLAEANLIISGPVYVPVPKDPAGGYTHSQHKLNGKALKHLGVAYLISGDPEYASYAKKIFMAYASLYPDLGQHPVKESYAPGKLFWQQLNEAVWLVDAIQGYDAIYDYLNSKERTQIEEKLLIPYAKFLSNENRKVFNRLHNHGVWAAAAVGMTGIAIGDDELVLRALFGINEKGKPNRETFSMDDIDVLEAGFLIQTQSLFSPDGYYTEGPYYQRYAMTPFLMFAQSIDHNFPELEIMSFGDGIYIKAVETLVDLADAAGRYFAINDNLKGMSLYSPESISALCFLYAKTKSPSILDLLKDASLTSINANSLAVTQDLSKHKLVTLKRVSKLIRDGKDGDQGGIALIRDVDDEFCSVLKYASHGLSHGHYDRLNVFYYNRANEILTDYGSVRYVNIQAKEGGRYLPENTSYAKQSIAHNTLVVNETSHFKSEYEEAQKYHSDLVYSDMEDLSQQFVCARETNAYPGIEMIRIMGLISDEEFSNPILLDVFKVRSEDRQSIYDMPYHFKGDIINAGFKYKAYTETQEALGEAYGYQHLWKIAEGNPSENHASLSWLDNQTIHTLSLAVEKDSKLFLARTGASDPNFNMRSEPALILRENNKADHVFAAILETHGNQDESTEMVSNQKPGITGVRVLKTDPEYVAVAFETRKSKYIFLSVTGQNQLGKEHRLNIAGKKFKWKGTNTIIKIIK